MGARPRHPSRLRRSGSRARGSTPRFATIAAITGLKSPWLREHSTGVAELAEAAAWRMRTAAGLDHALRRAALAHDLGRVGVSNAIWEKPGSLAFGEWERVRLHAHFTERAFAQSPALARSGAWPAHTTSGSTAPATTAASAGPSSSRPPASSPLPTATARCAKRGRTGRRSTRPRGGGRAAARGAGGAARPGRGRRRARGRRPPRLQAAARAAGRPDTARAGGAARARARRFQPGDRRQPRHLGRRPSGTTSSTSTRRPACAAARPRRSGPSSRTSFRAHRA